MGVALELLREKLQFKNLSSLTRFIPKEILAKVLPSLHAQTLPSIGLDWSDSEVRVVEIQKRPDGLELSHAYAGKFQDEPITAIKKALALANVSSTSVRVAISGEGVVVRHLVLPQMNPEELASAINFELEKYIPYKTSEVIVDYQLLEETLEKKVRVLLVAVLKNRVHATIEFLKQADLRPLLVDVAGFAVANAFLFNNIHPKLGEAVGLVHVVKDLTHVIILKDHFSYFTRDIGLGQSQIQSDIALLTDLVNEIRLSFDYYENQWGDAVKSVYVSGELDPVHVDPFQKALGLGVFSWDPLQAVGISTGLSKEELQGMKSHLHLALGLAIRQL